MSKFIILTLAVFLVLEDTGVNGCAAPGLCGYGYFGGYKRSLFKKLDKDFWEQKEFLFGVERTGNPYVYRDGNGNLVGFTIDVINAVCAIAEKTCHVTDTHPTACSRTAVNTAFAAGDYFKRKKSARYSII